MNPFRQAHPRSFELQFDESLLGPRHPCVKCGKETKEHHTPPGSRICSSKTCRQIYLDDEALHEAHSFASLSESIAIAIVASARAKIAQARQEEQRERDRARFIRERRSEDLLDVLLDAKAEAVTAGVDASWIQKHRVWRLRHIVLMRMSGKVPLP